MRLLLAYAVPLMQLQNRRPLWVDDLVKDVPLWAEATQWALGLTGRWYLLLTVSGGCNPEEQSKG